ncbi:MAG: tetratricopeptide repeat protein [Acidobacteriota bacterium]
MKRTERHHLKEDEVAEGVSWLVDFFQSYRREIFIVAGAVAVAALVFVGLLAVRSHARNARSEAIGRVNAVAAEAETDPAKLADLEKLAARGRTARLATLELAKHWAERSDWAKAESYLAKMPAGPKDLLYYQAEDLKGQVAVGRKDYDKAIAIYKKTVDEKPKVYPMDAALFRLAETHELKGEIAAALDLYKKLQTDFPQSYFGYEASLKAGKLEVRR